MLLPLKRPSKTDRLLGTQQAALNRTHRFFVENIKDCTIDDHSDTD
jgi:hypothetical protein